MNCRDGGISEDGRGSGESRDGGGSESGGMVGMGVLELFQPL